MTSASGGSSAIRIVVALAGVVIILAGMKFASTVLSPLLLSAFLATVSAPAVGALHRRGLPNWAAIAVTCLSVVAIGAVVGFVLYSSLSQLSAEMPSFEAQLSEQTQDIEAWLADHGIDAGGGLSLPAFDGRSLGTVATKLIGAILDALSSFLLIFMMTIFFLIDAGLVVTKGEAQLARAGNRWPNLVASVKTLQRFFVIKSIENLIISAGMVVLLLIFDVPYPLLWGIIGFFLSYIPSVGLIMACIPPVLLAYATSGITAAVVIAVGVLVINQVGDNVILPLMAAKGLNMPLSIQFAAFIVWTWVLGPTGALLAIPLTMVVRMLLSMSERTAWLAAWFSGRADETAGDDVTPASPEAVTSA